MPLQPYRNVGSVNGANNALGTMQDIQQMQQRNALFDLGQKEYAANAPVREAARRTSLDAAELQSITDGAVAAMPFIQAGDDAGLLRSVQNRYQNLVEQGRDPSDTQDILNMLQSGDTGQITQAKEIITAIAGGGEEGGIERQNVQSTFVGDNGNLFTVRRNGDVVDTGYKPSENVQLVTRPDGSTIAVDTKGTNAGQPVATVVTQEEALKGKETASKVTETGKLTAQLELEPQIKSAVAQAEATANAAADLAKEQKSNATTFAVYETAMSSLMDGLGNTDTGPFVGRIPAVTANQQIADGAIAAIAPVLKQLFRAAGEGIFTDKDQELLLAMVPKRSDLPAARESKFRNIDAIVRAKLRIYDNPTQPSDISNEPSNIDDIVKKYQ